MTNRSYGLLDRPSVKNVKQMNNLSHRLCVAPMMVWTDRHCRYFLRLVSPRALLYTEMITTGALMFGNVPRHLDYDSAEHPVALQLGGSDAQALAHCARLGEAWGYDEINFNVGCPSERVQTGSFGACLMAEPALVAACVAAIRDAVALPVTVKHRVGIDAVEDYAFVRDFVGTVARAGATAFLFEARVPYAEAQLVRGVAMRAIARHVLGLYHGAPGARAWRRILSDEALLKGSGPEIFLRALREVEPLGVGDDSSAVAAQVLNET